LREVADSIVGEDAAIWRSRSRSGAVSPFETIAGLLTSALGNAGDAKATLVASLAGAGVPTSRARVVADACLSLVAPGKPGARSAGEDRDALFAAWLD